MILSDDIVFIYKGWNNRGAIVEAIIVDENEADAH